jgi:glycine/D-amino acid oxidase-like deaminating enzyme
MTTPTMPAWPPSLWAATTPAGPALSELVGTFETDVCVIGAGFTGLSTALHLAKAGHKVMVVEAAEPGWGASGRNNGQVIPTLSRPDPDDIIARHGEAGERFVHLIRDSASILFDLVRAEHLDAEAEQTGWVQPVHSAGRMKIAERRVAQWSKHGAKVDLLSRQALASKLGTDVWHGGWTAPSGGHINPLALVRALTRAVLAHGGTIHACTPVTAINRTRTDWVMTMPRARIAAKSLIVATNAYTGEFTRGILPDIAREVIPVHSWQMATAPLGDSLRARIMPERNAVSDTHGELYFMRYDARHRLVTGGALINRANGAERLKAIVGARLQRLFPEIGPVEFDYVWNGYVGMTRDFMPRFHQIGPDGYTWVGCNGRAVGLSIAIGREFAKAATGAPRRELALPFTTPEPVPFHAIARRVAPLALLKYRWRDRREV